MPDVNKSGEGSNNPDSMDQKPADLKTVRMVEEMFSEAKGWRRKFDVDWIENHKFLRGKQWKDKRPSYRHSEVLNFTHAAVQTIIPILTDARPNIEALPEEPSDLEFSELMTQILRSKWDREVWGERVAEAIIDSATVGSAISKISWNPDLLDGLGDLEFKVIDYMNFYPDPRATDINDGIGRYVIEATPTNVNEVRRRFPKKAKSIKGDVSSLDDAKTARLDLHDTRVRSAVDNLTLVHGETPRDDTNQDQVLLIECWMDSDEVIEKEIEQKDKDGKISKAFQQVKKYPRGRKILIANGILLEDVPNPYKHGKFPYTKLVDYIEPREFWGMGEVEQLKGPQIMINKIISYMMDTMILMSNPLWMVPTGSGVETENLINKPGLVVEYSGEERPHREQGVNMPAFITQTFDRLVNLFDKISGVHDVSQGVAPSGASGIAIDLLQEAAQTKLRLKGRNVDGWLTKSGQLMSSLVLQFYETPRVIRITNNEGAANFFKFAVDEIENESGEIQQIATIEESVPDGQGGILKEIRQIQIKSNLDLRISTGTELPLRKAKKAANAKELFAQGIIGPKELLEALEWPNPERTALEFEKKQEAAAQAEAEAALAEQQAVQQQQQQASAENQQLELVKQGVQPPPV